MTWPRLASTLLMEPEPFTWLTATLTEGESSVGAARAPAARGRGCYGPSSPTAFRQGAVLAA